MSGDGPVFNVGVPGTLQAAPRERGWALGRRKVECLVYFGQPIHEFSDGLEALYQSLMTMESALLTAAQQSTAARYLETVLDEDRVDAYKLMALRVELQG